MKWWNALFANKIAYDSYCSTSQNESRIMLTVTQNGIWTHIIYVLYANFEFPILFSATLLTLTTLRPLILPFHLAALIKDVDCQNFNIPKF